MLISRNVPVSSLRMDVAADVIEVASKMAPSQEDTTDEQVEKGARSSHRPHA